MCPANPALQGGVKGHNINEITLPRSPALQGGELHKMFEQNKEFFLPKYKFHLIYFSA
jgi:hypothetical protein